MSSRVLFAAKRVPVTSCTIGCQVACAAGCQSVCLTVCQASCLAQCEGPCTTSCQSTCTTQCQSYWTTHQAAPFTIQYYCGPCTVYEEGFSEDPEPALVSSE
jgi:hypothetical protein